MMEMKMATSHLLAQTMQGRKILHRSSKMREEMSELKNNCCLEELWELQQKHNRIWCLKRLMEEEEASCRQLVCKELVSTWQHPFVSHMEMMAEAGR